jgi:hypothetical protein
MFEDWSFYVFKVYERMEKKGAKLNTAEHI